MWFGIDKYETIAIKVGKIVEDDGMQPNDEDLLKAVTLEQRQERNFGSFWYITESSQRKCFYQIYQMSSNFFEIKAKC